MKNLIYRDWFNVTYLDGTKELTMKVAAKDIKEAKKVVLFVDPTAQILTVKKEG